MHLMPLKQGCPDTLAEQNRNIPKRNKIVHLGCGFSAYKGFTTACLTFFIIRAKSGTKSCTSKRLQAALSDMFCILCGTKKEHLQSGTKSCTSKWFYLTISQLVKV